MSRGPLSDTASPVNTAVVPRHLDWFGAMLVLLSAIAFSAKAIFVKLAYNHPVDALTLLTLRMVFALPLFLLVAWWAGRAAGKQRLTQREWIIVACLGLIGYYAASLLDFLGLQYVSAALERLVLFLSPTFVVLFSALFFGYGVVRRDIFALAVCYLGIVLVFANDVSASQSNIALGTGLVFLSALCYAGYLVGAGQMVTRIGSLRFAAYASIVSSIAIFAHFAIARDLKLLAQPAPVLWLSLVMAVVSTVLPVILMAEGMRRIGSSNASMLSSIGPIATIFMGAVFLGEPISPIQLAGAFLVLAGVLAISLKKKAAALSVESD